MSTDFDDPRRPLNDERLQAHRCLIGDCRKQFVFHGFALVMSDGRLRFALPPSPDPNFADS
jgi:hypothetical protein